MANPISVEVYTGSHRILGRITPGGVGLYAYINDRTRSTIEIEGAHLNRLHQPARLVARYPRLWLNKRNTVAILLSSRGELGAVSMTRSGYSTLVPTGVHVLLPAFELTGQMEVPGRLEISKVLHEGDTVFMPMYDCHLQAILFPEIQTSSPVLLFNSNTVAAMSPLPKSETRGA